MFWKSCQNMIVNNPQNKKERNIYMNEKQVCGECKLFTNEDSFGNGWCEYHQRKVFCENIACQNGEIKGRDFSSRVCGECDAFCECSLGGSSAAMADDAACQYFDDTTLSQMR